VLGLTILQGRLLAATRAVGEVTWPRRP
jgi:hypothetical protein